MAEEELPLNKEELSELEKELSGTLKKSREKLSPEEIEEAKKDFLRKKQENKETEQKELPEQDSEESKERNDQDTQNNTKEDIRFIDKNKFTETLSQINQILERTDSQTRESFAKNLEQQVGWNITPTAMTAGRARDSENQDDSLKYSLTNYDNAQEKKYTIENDVDHHLVRNPERPASIDFNQLGKENPARQEFNRQVDFKNPYPSQNQGDSNLEKSYIQSENIDPEQAGRKRNSFFESEFSEGNKKERKYKVR